MRYLAPSGGVGQLASLGEGLQMMSMMAIGRRWGIWRGMLMAVVALILASCSFEEVAAPVKLTIDSVPESGADVYVNGKPLGQTPLVLSEQTPGTLYVIKLEKEGFKTAGDSLVLGEEDETLSVRMMRRVGYISLDSVPSRASVFLGGKFYLGDTPLVGREVPIGAQEFRIEKEGCDHYDFSLEIEEDFRYQESYALTYTMGVLDIFSTPTNAEIWINEERQDQRTPSRIQLSPGTYTVGVFSKGYVMGEETFILEPAGSKDLEFKMRPGKVPRAMVLVPAGEFVRGLDGGAPDERPLTLLTLDAFYIDKFEVTNAEYAFIFPGHSYPDAEGRYPVLDLTFEEAQAYAKVVGKRLPTESEWEKAARGPKGYGYPWGNTFDPLLCNAKTEAVAGPKKVGRYRLGVSGYGCMDMAGNAYEWTSSWYQAYEGNIDITQEYGQVFRVLRGGSYDTVPFDVRSACRHFDKMDSSRGDYGFRCAKDIGEGHR